MKYPFLLILSLFAQLLFSQENIYEVNETYSLGSDGTIFLNASDADISIEGSNRSDVHIVVYRKVTGKRVAEQKFSVIVKEKGGDITLDDHIVPNKKGNSHWKYSKKTDYRITINAPQSAHLNIISEDGNIKLENLNGNLEAVLEDGDLDIQNSELKNVKILTEDGNVSMLGKITETAQFHSEDGNIDIQEINGKLDAVLEDGNLNINRSSLTACQISNEDGNVHLRTSLAGSGEHKITTEDGDVVMELLSGDATFTLSHEDGSVHTSGDFKTIKQDKRKTIVSTINTSETKVEISTEDGDITVKN